MKLLTYEQLREQPPLDWLVSGLIPAASLVLLYGPSGVGKSFLVLDLLHSIATGKPWLGHAVTQGPGLYIVAEGMGGFAQRAIGWCAARGCETPGPMRYVPEPVHFHELHERAELITNLQTAGYHPAITAVDTLHASLGGGSESNAQDMGILLDGVKSLQSAVGGAALLVHHTGWDTSRERGSSAIGAAVDVKIQVQPLAGGNLEIRVRKLRDGIEPPPFVLRLRATNGTAVPERVADYLSNLTAHHRALLSVLGDAEVHSRSQCITGSGLPKTTCDRARDELIAMSAIARNRDGLRITERGLELLRSDESQIPTRPKQSHGTSPAAVPHVPHPLGWDLGLRGGTGNGKGANATDAAARTCSDIRELEIERAGMQADA